MTENVHLKYVDWGMASCEVGVKPTISINKELLNYPSLHEYVLKHELGHALQKRSGCLVTKQDIFDELGGFDSKLLECAGFMLIHPKTWTEFLPIRISKNKVNVYPILMWIWCLFILISLLEIGVAW